MKHHHSKASNDYKLTSSKDIDIQIYPASRTDGLFPPVFPEFRPLNGSTPPRRLGVGKLVLCTGFRSHSFGFQWDSLIDQSMRLFDAQHSVVVATWLYAKVRATSHTSQEP
jgi:hypothetical protein